MLTLEVPLPPLAASPNRHEHRMTAAREAQAYRRFVAAVASEARAESGWPNGRRARLSLTFLLARARGPGQAGRYRPGDPDNALAACKGLLDGLVDAGVLVDDSWGWLEIGAVRCDRERGPGILVEVEALDG